MEAFGIKKKLLTLVILGMGLMSYAQQLNLEGFVKDEYGNTLENVKVETKGLDLSTYTDAQGYYYLQNVPDSIITLIFMHPDMENASASIGIYKRIDVRMVQKGSEELVEMSLEDLLNMDVTTASKSAEKQSDAPGIISVLTHDDLERFGGITLKDILERVPGMISSTVSYTNRTTMVVRGDFIKQNSSHILVLINGRPIREVQESGVSSEVFNTFPVNAIERIEVVKGPGSVLYGSDAFSGVINIITREAETNSASVTGLMQTGGGFKTSAEAYVSTGDFSAVVSGQYYEKTVWDAPYDAMVYTPIVDSPYYAMSDTSYTVPVPNRGPGVFIDMNYKNFRINTTYNEWTTANFQLFENVTNKKFFTNLGYTQEVTKNWNMDFNATLTQSELYGANLSERKSYNLVGEWTNFISLSEKLSLSAGGLFNRIDGTEKSLQDPDSTYTLSEGSRNGFALYTQLDYQVIDQIKLIAGLQGNKEGDLDMSFMPRAGLIWSPADRFSLKALYSQAYRAPSINELYMNFPTGLYGDENLKPEKVSTIDFGIGYQGEKGQVNASVFHSQQKDIIQPVYLPMSFERQYTNLGEVTFMGGELEGKYYINNKFYLTASALYQTNEDDSTSNLAPVANFGAKGGISYSSDNGITVSLFDIYQGDIDDKYIGMLNDHQGAYNLLHLHTEIELNALLPKLSIPKVSILFNIDNLLDRKVYLWDWGGFSYDALPVNPGREIFIGIKVHFE
jgi:outer membrane receptor protein involved in Fe transport